MLIIICRHTDSMSPNVALPLASKTICQKVSLADFELPLGLELTPLNLDNLPKLVVWKGFLFDRGYRTAWWYGLSLLYLYN